MPTVFVAGRTLFQHQLFEDPQLDACKIQEFVWVSQEYHRKVDIWNDLL
jgi:hypothetical protein